MQSSVWEWLEFSGTFHPFGGIASASFRQHSVVSGTDACKTA